MLSAQQLVASVTCWRETEGPGVGETPFSVNHFVLFESLPYAYITLLQKV